MTANNDRLHHNIANWIRNFVSPSQFHVVEIFIASTTQIELACFNNSIEPTSFICSKMYVST